MGLRYQKRFNLGNGSGINLSQSGASYSQRTKYGSVGTSGFSIKTGIPGLTFRKRWGKGGGAFLFMLTMVVLTFLTLLVYNGVRLIVYLIRTIYIKINTKEHGTKNSTGKAS